MVHAMVLSRLDYCNVVFHGLNLRDIARLQKVQNSAARFIFGRGKRSHVTELLKKVHFLPVMYRVSFKIALLVFKCLNNMAPQYLSNLVAPRNTKSNYLRADNDFFILEVPPTPCRVSTERAFIHSAPKVWNALPYEVRSASTVAIFKSALKTHYFKQAFAL